MPCVIPRPSHPPPDCRQPRPETDRGIHFQPGSQPLRLSDVVGRWCNGSTGVFEALSHGSNPCRPTNSERFLAPQSLQRVLIGGLLPLLSGVLPELPHGHRRGIPSARRVFRPVASGKSLGTRFPGSPRPGSVDRSTLTVERGAADTPGPLAGRSRERPVGERALPGAGTKKPAGHGGFVGDSAESNG